MDMRPEMGKIWDDGDPKDCDGSLVLDKPIGGWGGSKFGRCLGSCLVVFGPVFWHDNSDPPKLKRTTQTFRGWFETIEQKPFPITTYNNCLVVSNTLCVFHRIFSGFHKHIVLGHQHF